ncbi:MAG TPA: hypothetical protein VGZ22_14780 [Isosphaeraceae bacterium]|nr:hypothetical protein [Isosphaeraceae bacterium]
MRPLSATGGLSLSPQAVGLAVDFEPLGKQSMLTIQKGAAGAMASATASKIEPVRATPPMWLLTDTPEKLRAAFIMSEVLQPPLAMRPRRGF